MLEEKRNNNHRNDGEIVSLDMLPQIETVVADAAYKTPWICKRIIDDGRIPSTPYKRPMTKEGFLKSTSMYMMSIMTVSFAPTTRY